MFKFEYRPIFTDPDESDAVIASGKKWLCQDWRCPARNDCGRHFGLSKAYAAMELVKTTALCVPTRKGHDCRHFKPATRDYFAESLGQKRVMANLTTTGRA
jgi:hypothetical protein